MAIVFVPTDEEGSLYDLIVDGRAREYDIEPYDLKGALRRARITEGPVYIEDETGYRTRL